jgi:hypothetical protein
MRGSTRRAILALALTGAALPGLGASATSPDTQTDALAIRTATQPFREVSAATAAGYAILAGTPLEACIDEPGEGGMGFHYVNGDLVGDAVLDPLTPEALIYIPDAVGEPELVGVEYVVFQEAWEKANDAPPTLLGHEMHLVTEPNRYELPSFYQLHGWVWRSNPEGMFETWNPTVSCAPVAGTDHPAMPGASPDASTSQEPSAG